jgi:hypothetical protein
VNEPVEHPGDTEEDRSADACPVCGEHRLAIIDFPELPGGVASPAAELVGGRGSDPLAPSIGCLACGAEWADVEAFRRAADEAGSGGEGEETATGAG